MTQKNRAIELLEERIAAGHQYRSAPVFQAEEKKLIVKGYATTFNDPYPLIQFKDGNWTYEVWEQIDRNAFDEADMSDVIFQYDHFGRVFARTRNNTLEVNPDDHGLQTVVDLSRAADGEGLYNDIANGLIDRMSWRFTVAEQKREVTESDNLYKVLRTITKVGKVFDVSCVSIPANDGTEISARGYLDGVIEELKAERLENERKKKARDILALRIKIGGYLNENQ